MSDIGFRIITDIARPPRELVAKFRKHCTANLADCMYRFFCVDSAIKRINEKDVIMVGTAFTIKVRVADNLMVHKALDYAQPGDVLVIDAEGDTEHAILGEIMTREAMVNGLAGFLIDGAIRDAGKIKKMEFPVFARGVTPRGPFKDGPGEINTPVSCGGVVVNPGDIIVGDEDGVVVIPSVDAEDILKKVEIKHENEQKVIAEIMQQGCSRCKAWADKILKEKGCAIG
jgi:RraA family protein